MTKSKKTTPDRRVKEPASDRQNSQRKDSSEAYGDKVPICANTGCALRKKAKCFGFEGCPGFKSK